LKESIFLPIHKKVNETDFSNYRGILLSISHKILTNILLSRLPPYADEIVGNHHVDLNVRGQRINRFSISGRYRRKNGSIVVVHQLLTDFKKANDLVMKEVLYDILIKFEIPKERDGIIKMCLDGTYSIVRTEKF
jgi:hypothetical protein